MSKLAEGGFGCVYKPAFTCSNYINRPGAEISKVFKKTAELVKEQERYAKLKLQQIPNNADYFVTKPKRCLVQSQRYTQPCEDFLPHGATFDVLNYLYGGQSLASILKDRAELVDANLLSALENIFVGVAKMNADMKYHLDIKPQNIVYDGKKFRLIDFGISKNLNVDAPENAFFKSHRYGYWPVELTFVNYPMSKVKGRPIPVDVEKILMEHLKTYFHAISVGSNLSEFVKLPKTSDDMRELLVYFSGLTTDQIYAKVDTWGLGMTLIDIHDAMPEGPVKGKLFKFIKSFMMIKTKERMSADKLALHYHETFNNSTKRAPLKQINKGLT